MRVGNRTQSRSRFLPKYSGCFERAFGISSRLRSLIDEFSALSFEDYFCSASKAKTADLRAIFFPERMQNYSGLAYVCSKPLRDQWFLFAKKKDVIQDPDLLEILSWQYGTIKVLAQSVLRKS